MSEITMAMPNAFAPTAKTPIYKDTHTLVGYYATLEQNKAWSLLQIASHFEYLCYPYRIISYDTNNQTLFTVQEGFWPIGRKAKLITTTGAETAITYTVDNLGKVTHSLTIENTIITFYRDYKDDFYFNIADKIALSVEQKVITLHGDYDNSIIILLLTLYLAFYQI